MTTNPWGIDGYGPSSYGDAFADVYDEWYADLGDDDFVTTLADLLGDLTADRPARVLELGVGTGRLLSRLAAARGDTGDVLHGVDTSRAMLERAGANLPSAALSEDDFSRSLPDGPFDLVFCGWNTLLNLPDDEAVVRTYGLVASRLAPGGLFAVDAALPSTDRAGDDMTVRSITADRVVLSVSRHEPAQRRITGQFVELAHGSTPVLRPWSVRWVPVEDLDACASDAGLTLFSRAADGRGTPFTEESTRHVSVWRAP